MNASSAEPARTCWITAGLYGRALARPDRDRDEQRAGQTGRAGGHGGEQFPEGLTQQHRADITGAGTLRPTRLE